MSDFGLIEDIICRIKKENYPSIFLDKEIAKAFAVLGFPNLNYTFSVDSAIKLVPKNFIMNLEFKKAVIKNKLEHRYVGVGSTPAISLTIAALLAHFDILKKESEKKLRVGKIKSVSVEEIKNMVRYCPDTGMLFWKKREGNINGFNKKHANKPALININEGGYYNGRINKMHCLAHHVAWALYYNEWPDSTMEIDHINGIRTDNRIKNLRIVGRAENMQNTKKSTRNKSGFVGVFWNNQFGKWHAKINCNGKPYNLGFFENKEDAILARKKANEEFGFHQGHGKVIPVSDTSANNKSRKDRLQPT